METSFNHQVPEALMLSSEQFLMDILDPLDPLLNLKLTILIKQLIKISYLMGQQDCRVPE